MVFLQFGRLSAPSESSDTARKLFEFAKWAFEHHPERVDWTIDDINQHGAEAHQWYLNKQNEQNQQQQMQNVYMFDPNVGQDLVMRSPSHSASRSRSPTKTNSVGSLLT